MKTKTTSGTEVVAAGSAGVGPTVPGSSGGQATLAGAATVAPRTGFQEAVQEMLQGFQTYLPAGTTLQSSGGGYSQATVVAQLQSILGLYAAAATAKQSSAAAVATLHAATLGAEALMKALKAAVVGFYGPGSPALAKFGIVEKARAKPSSLQSAVKAAKAMQTRKVNGTQSKKQKAAAALATQAQTVFAPQGAATQAPVAPEAIPAKPTTPGQ